MSNDNKRLNKIASNLSEEDRLKQLSAAADVRRDIEETLGTDIVDQYRLEQIAEAIWRAVPPAQRPSFTAQAWQQAIYERCAAALAAAERHLMENRYDERLFAAKVKVLHTTFSNQVIRAMTDVAEKYRR